MPDKQRERDYLAVLQEIMPEIPCVPPTEHEPPDFVFCENEHRLGIELTEFHLPPDPGNRPHQEQQSLKDQIVRYAANYHETLDGRPLFVDICFDGNLSLRKADIRPMAKLIVQTVVDVDAMPRINSPSTEVPLDDLPGGISHITVCERDSGHNRIWIADAGGWVADITPVHIKNIIANKKRSAEVARKECDELWLVIVNDCFSRAAPAEISSQAIKAKYEHPFDRLLWFVPNPLNVYELRHTQSLNRHTAGNGK